MPYWLMRVIERFGPHLADQPGGMPGGAAGELALLEQHDVAPAELGEVVGDARADDAAADDDDFGVAVHRFDPLTRGS